MVSLEKFKLSLVSWDSDKDPGGYPKWVKQWSSVVRSTKWGSQLESFLDRKLKRKFSTKSIIPSFLTEDEDLQDAPEAQPPQEGQVEQGSDHEEDPVPVAQETSKAEEEVDLIS